MKAFWDEVQLTHAPQFFLQRGTVKPNFEMPARAEALLAACREMAAWKSSNRRPPARGRRARGGASGRLPRFPARRSGARGTRCAEHGAELVPNIHPSPEMLANGARRSANDHRPGRLVHRRHLLSDRRCDLAGRRSRGRRRDRRRRRSGGRREAAYALARPPGHHAYAARAGGHCYLNNAAIAAERLRAQRRGPGRDPRHRQPPRQRHPGDLLAARRCAVRLRPRRSERVLSLVCRPRRRARRRRGGRLQPQPAAAAGHRRRGLAACDRRGSASGRADRRPTRWSSASDSTRRATSRSGSLP